MTTTATQLAALLLADGRLPAGGHAHSFGVESAVADGRISDLRSLEAFVRGRLSTVTITEAALAAATVWRMRLDDPATALRALDAEADARIGPASLKQASRRLGRQLLRVAGRCWPPPALV